MGCGEKNGISFRDLIRQLQTANYKLQDRHRRHETLDVLSSKLTVLISDTINLSLSSLISTLLSTLLYSPLLHPALLVYSIRCSASTRNNLFTRSLDLDGLNFL